jgi:mono/diheme cytochrome c family protein
MVRGVTARRRLRAASALLLTLLFCTRASRAAPPAALEFRRDGQLVARLDLARIEAACPVRTVTIDDPYYGRRKAYRGCDLRPVLQAAFGAPIWQEKGRDVVLRALDGYAKPTSTARLGEPGAFLAFADAEHAHGDDPGWQPIDRRGLDPGPFYLVWTGKDQQDPRRYPWPYQLASIELVDPAKEWPHTLPSSAPSDSAPWRGYAIFRRDCISCHSINGEGGKVGPDLNVPRSIVEYRPIQQIEDFIFDPTQFRYTSMPPHRYLKPQQLQDLIAYFETMKDLKHDPGAKARE